MRRIVKLAFVQQSENKANNLTRCQNKSAFMMMSLGFFEFSGIKCGVFGQILAQLIGGLDEIIPKIFVATFTELCFISREAGGLIGVPVDTRKLSQRIVALEA